MTSSPVWKWLRSRVFPRGKLAWLRLPAILLLLAVLALGGIGGMVYMMPGESYEGPWVPLSDEEAALARRLEGHVRVLAEEIGERNLSRRADELERSARHIEKTFREIGYEPAAQEYAVERRSVRNLAAELPGKGREQEIVVVGAHYDSTVGTPGANDNGSGVASLLEIARALRDAPLSRTVRFVAFVNEEMPYFTNGDMGSQHYARLCRERGDRVEAMLSLETIGYYSNKPGSQQYPPLVSSFYPDQGNFVAFVGNLRSGALTRKCLGSFRRHTQFPSVGASLPAWVPGVGWSDHRSFWEQGYPGVMVTDTAPFRYPHYHLPSDTADKVDFERLARVTAGLIRVVRDLARADETGR